MKLPVFLTSFDPTDLPGGSVDPLGFEPAYIWLADRILPGLTVAGAAPRYLSVLCAGIALADVQAARTDRERAQGRQEAQQRLERLWALANVLASEQSEQPLGGLRGVTYAAGHLETLRQRGEKAAGADGWKLLSAQVPYGAVGIYANVAAGMQLIHRKSLRLSVDLGEKLAQAFLDETRCPRPIQRAAREGGAVPLSVLADWGARAHVSAATGAREARWLRDAMGRDAVRLRMIRHLKQTPPAEEETELQRLTRAAEAIPADSPDIDLKRAVEVIVRFESAYQMVLLTLERVLWRCRANPAGPQVSWAVLDGDPPLKAILEELPALSAGLVLARGRLPASSRLDAALGCIRAAAAATDVRALVSAVVARHAEVQGAKKVRGRPKMPWVELDDAGASLTLTRIGGLSREAKQPAQIAPHVYRSHSADQLRRAAHGA